MKSRENTNKGYNRTLKYSNGLELQFHDCTVDGYFSRYVRDTYEDFAQRVGLMGSERAGLGH